MSTPKPMVSVIVPHYNDLENLDLCLRYLIGQNFAQSDFEIVIVDNNSNIELRDIAVLVGGRARLLREELKGAGPARNKGVKAAKGSILAFTDSDCRPAPDWLASGLVGLNNYDIVSGQIRVAAKDEGAPTPAESFEIAFEFDCHKFVNKYGFAPTANMFVSKAHFERVGWFNSRVSEDLDWCHRATRIGLRLGYEPKALVVHPARASVAALKKKWSRVTRESFLLHLDNGGSNAYWIARSIAILGSPIWHIPILLASRKLKFVDKFKAFAILCYIRGYRFYIANKIVRCKRTVD